MEGKFKSKDAKARNRAGIFPGLRDNRLPHTVSILQIILRYPVPQKIPPQTVTVYAEAFVLLRIYFLFRLQSVNFSKVLFGEFDYHR